MIDRTALPNFLDRDLETTPIERAETAPSSWYTDPRFHELDRESVFARTWQAVGHVRQVQETGDHLTAMVAGNPIIVVRGGDGELRAFYNVCRHRGGPLVCKGGNTRFLQCQYHGWTYLLDGSLRGAPQFDRAEQFDRKDYGLIPVRVDSWEGLLFVNLREDPPPLHASFEGIPERIAPEKLSTKTFCRRVEYEMKCNWKVYIDNYLEGYHVPIVHPELWKMYQTQQYVTETSTWYSLQYSPLRGNGDKSNVYNTPGGKAFYYCVFPNFMLNVLPGRLQTNVVVPLAHNRTQVIFEYYYDGDVSSPGAPDTIEEDIAFADRVQQEDGDICERVQLGLESRAYDRGRFSPDMEQGVHHFYSLLKRAYRQWAEGVYRESAERE